jgi:hypothetical protein
LHHFLSLTPKGGELMRQARQDDGSSMSALHDHGLLGECLSNLGRPGFTHTRGKLREPTGQLLFTDRAELCRRGIALKQIEHGKMVESRAEHSFQSGVDLSQQSSYAITGLRDLSSEIIIEPAEHGELCDLIISQFKRAQRVRHAACSLGNDVRIASVGFGFASVQISDATHSKPWQVGDKNTFVSCDSDGQRADSGGLVNNEKNLSTLF